MLSAPRADIELQAFLVDLELARVLFQQLEMRGRRGHLVVERFALLRQRPEFRFHLPDFLSTILQNKELLQLGLHARTLGARASGVNQSRTRPRTTQELIPPKPKELFNT